MALGDDGSLPKSGPHSGTVVFEFELVRTRRRGEVDIGEKQKGKGGGLSNTAYIPESSPSSSVDFRLGAFCAAWVGEGASTGKDAGAWAAAVAKGLGWGTLTGSGARTIVVACMRTRECQ